MSKAVAKVLEDRKWAAKSSGELCVGRIVRIDDQQRIWVQVPGQGQCPQLARVVSTAASPDGPCYEKGAPVLLTFEDQDPTRPIVIGPIVDRVSPPSTLKVALTPADQPLEARLDGKTVVLHADERIELRCGQSSLLLTKDGKVVVRGVDIVSRGTRVNKIRGGSVQIN